MKAMPREPRATPQETAYAWARYRRLMRWMLLVAILAVLAAFAYLWASGISLGVHMLIATAAGVGLSVLLGTGLMGLVFLSNGSGHDEDTTRPEA
jgi:hypothetical protein